MSELDRYPAELLDEDEDDGTMVENLADFSAAVVGHRIVLARKVRRPTGYSYDEKFVITLDNGTEVELTDNGECCAYTRLEDFLLNVDQIDDASQATRMWPGCRYALSSVHASRVLVP
jgi:hypothetical protein